MDGFSGRWKRLQPRLLARPGRDRRARRDARAHRPTADARCPRASPSHPKIAATARRRREDVNERKPIDWAHAEALAFGSLLLGGHAGPAQRPGQPARHVQPAARLARTTPTPASRYYPLAHLDPDQATFDVYDSLLSEAAVLGFEFGYSLDAPERWCCGRPSSATSPTGPRSSSTSSSSASESKWQRASGLVMLLPHGYEGQGPEHSSARLERFLQLCAEDNIQVVLPDHAGAVLPRAAAADEARLPQAAGRDDAQEPAAAQGGVSPVEEFTSGRFREVLDDATRDPDRVRRVLLCSGKVYYDLAREADRRETQRRGDRPARAVLPVPRGAAQAALSRYRKAQEWVWVQEESQNMGGWSFVEPRLRALGFPFEYVGRDASASPATGSHHDPPARAGASWSRRRLDGGPVAALVRDAQPGRRSRRAAGGRAGER